MAICLLAGLTFPEKGKEPIGSGPQCLTHHVHESAVLYPASKTAQHSPSVIQPGPREDDAELGYMGQSHPNQWLNFKVDGWLRKYHSIDLSLPLL